MINLHRWEKKAEIIYKGTQWERKAIAAGKAMDNRLNRIDHDLFGQYFESSSFDMLQWLAWFDYEVLIRRGLQDKMCIL